MNVDLERTSKPPFRAARHALVSHLLQGEKSASTETDGGKQCKTLTGKAKALTTESMPPSRLKTQTENDK